MHGGLMVPGAVPALAGLGSGVTLLNFAIVPLALALPFILFAAIRGTDHTTDLALGAARAVGCLTFAGALFCAILWSVLFGLVVAGTGVAMLVAAGTGLDERRLGAVTALTGIAVGAASMVLVWFGTDGRLLIAGALGLGFGGLMWALEAHFNPRTVEVIPTMTLAS